MVSLINERLAGSSATSLCIILNLNGCKKKKRKKKRSENLPSVGDRLKKTENLQHLHSAQDAEEESQSGKSLESAE